MKDNPDIPEVSEVSLLSIVWLIKLELSLILKMCLGYSMEASGALPALLHKTLFFHLFQAKCQDEVKVYWTHGQGELAIHGCLLRQSITMEERNSQAHGVEPNSVCASEN